MAGEIIRQPVHKLRDAHRAAQPLSPAAAAPAQSPTEAGFDFGRPVPVAEFLEQIKRDDHKRFIRAWKLSCRLGIALATAFEILMRQDCALIDDKPTASAIVSFSVDVTNDCPTTFFKQRLVNRSPPKCPADAHLFVAFPFIAPSVPRLERAPTTLPTGVAGSG